MAKSDGIRVLRVGRQVLESLTRYVNTRSTWEVPGQITLTRVRMSKDLKSAKVGVRLLTFDSHEEANHELAALALRQKVHELQHFLAQDLKLRFTPKLQIVADEAWDDYLKVEQTLRDLEQGKKVHSD